MVSKEESESERIELGVLDLPEKAKKWLVYCNRKSQPGKVVVLAQPMVNNKLSDEEREKRESVKEEKSDNYKKRVAANKKVREDKVKVIQKRIADRKQKRIIRLNSELDRLK